MNGYSKASDTNGEVSNPNLDTFANFSTLAIHAGQSPEQWKSRAVVPLISLSTTFQQDEPSSLEAKGFVYTRCSNPTRHVAEECLKALDNAKHCLLFGSGQAALVNLCHTLKSGDHVICSDDVYGGTNVYLSRILSNMDITTTFVDATDPENVQRAIKPNTKMVLIETPTNPTLKVANISEICRISHQQQPGIIVVIDNTFMSSYFQRPLDLGADVTFQSLTKYMNGHSDVLMGSLSLNNDKLAEKLRFLQCTLGCVPSPFDCYLLNRGLKTLALRMREHMKNGLIVARYLEKNPRVEKVIHPGLPSHPQYKLSLKQSRGFSGMISFLIKGQFQEAKTFLTSLKLFTLAMSLGGFDSLAEHPSTMTHAAMDKMEKSKLGITDSMIRISVGLEDVHDLIDDLEQALVKAIPMGEN